MRGRRWRVGPFVNNANSSRSLVVELDVVERPQIAQLFRDEFVVRIWRVVETEQVVLVTYREYYVKLVNATGIPFFQHIEGIYRVMNVTNIWGPTGEIIRGVEWQGEIETLWRVI